MFSIIISFQVYKKNFNLKKLSGYTIVCEVILQNLGLN